MVSLILTILYFFTLLIILIVTQIWCWKVDFLRSIINKIKNFIELLLLFLYWFGDIKFQTGLLRCCISNGNILDRYNLLSVISIYLIPIVILTVIVGFYLNSISSIIGMICVIILWAILVIKTVKVTEKYCKKSELHKNGVQNGKFSVNEPHHGIVFVQYQNPKFQLFIADSIDLLVKAFNEHIPFKVYPIKNEDDFKQVYNNSSIHWLWILGHGERRHLSYVENNEIKNIEYENYQQKPNLLFIAQLHCNPGNGKSLPEVNNLKPDYDITKFRFPFQNRCYIMKKTKEFIESKNGY
jgi:hypothetical protein